MTSIFSINPPKFTNREIEKYLMPKFELSGKSTDLYSDRDQNFCRILFKSQYPLVGTVFVILYLVHDSKYYFFESNNNSHC